MKKCKKIFAVIEVVLVFSCTLFLVAWVGQSPFGTIEQQGSNLFFIEYGIMILFPLLLLLVFRRDLVLFGLSLRNFSYQMDVAGTALIPVAISSIVFALVDYREWHGSLVVAVLKIAVLFSVGWLLKSKPTVDRRGGLFVTILPLIMIGLFAIARLGDPLSVFVFYLFFVGFGEEFLFRGYIQSRLNTAFGKNFIFMGVHVGWGLIITSLLFGLMHVLNIGSWAADGWELAWWWGFWTFFSGLVLGFVREKTGSIYASAILHGLPQAIALAFLSL